MSEPDAKSTPIRRAYGRGYHDAMRSISKEQDMTNQARLDEAERSLSGIAQKVLDCTPKAEAWTVAQISGELRRAGKNIDLSVVAGCLSTMLRSGLVREPQSGSFIRVVGKQKPVLAAVPAEPAEPAGLESTTEPQRPAVDDRGTLAKLADLSCGVRAMALQFADLARAIDDVAIEVEERMQAVNADSQKLAQLRALLKGIGA